MIGGNIIIILIIGFGFGIFLFIAGFSKLKQKRLIENIPTSKIRSLAMGLVEVYGEAISKKEPLISPLSNSKCVYYRLTVEEYRSSGKSSRWVTIDREEKREQFYVKDETGKVLIDPKKAEIDIPIHYKCESGFRNDPSKAVQTYLKSKNISFESFFGMNKKMRYTEYYIDEKEKIYVMGTAGINEDIKASSKGYEKVIIRKEGRNIYYISDKPEKDVLKKLRWQIIGGIYGGASILVTCLMILIFNSF